MESVHRNASEYTRVRNWQHALMTDGRDTAEAIVLGYVLDGWLIDLNFRLGFEKRYRSRLDRYTQLKQTISYIDWLLDRMAADLPEGQTMVTGHERVLFGLLRDAGLDLSIRVMGIEQRGTDEGCAVYE